MSGVHGFVRRRWFWLVAGALEGLILLVALRSVERSLLLTVALGFLVLMAPLFGTRRGTTVFALLLVVTTLVLPGEMALRYRIPVGGGGIFIIDILLALLVGSWVLTLVAGADSAFLRSPVTLPLVLFLAWTGFAGANGYLAGNDVKVILQDSRGLAYFVLFPWVLWAVRSRADVLFWLKVLAGCAFAGFGLGVYYAAMGQGMALTYVEAGVSRFPAPNEVFVLSAALSATIVVVWPAGRRRPFVLWALLAVSVAGVILAFVRGYWIGLACGLLYLVVVARTRQRLRLVGGGLAVLVVLAVTTAALDPGLFASVVTRATAVAAYNSDTSVQYRLIENRAVWRQIIEHPVLGNGLGTTYFFDFSRYGVAAFYKVYIHNNYLWFAQRLGSIGLGLFIWMMVAFLASWRGLRAAFAGGDPWLVGLVVGSRVMIVSLLVISVSSPQFNVKGEVAVIAMVMALAEVAGGLLRESGAAALATAPDSRPEDEAS